MIAATSGALLVVDDIQAGCGRTGTFFSFEPAGLEPDLVVLSKSLSGFGLPDVGAAHPSRVRRLGAGGAQRHVPRQQPRLRHRPGGPGEVLDEHAAAGGHQPPRALVTERLQDVGGLVPVSRVKGRGMMQGLDVGSGELAARIARRCFEEGLVIETAGNRGQVLKVLAPLTTPDDLLDEGLQMLERSAKDAISSGSIRSSAGQE